MQENIHTDNAMELCWKHTGFPRSRGSLSSLWEIMKERETRRALVSIRQHFVLGKTLSLFSSLSSPFIAQGEKVVIADHITFILYLMNALLRICTSIILHNKYVQLSVEYKCIMAVFALVGKQVPLNGKLWRIG